MTVQFSSDVSGAQRVSPQPVEIYAPAKETISTRLYRNGVKRALDVFFTLMAVPIIVPLVGVMALLIALDGHNPFYSQQRVGRNGKTFRMWKLRTMVHNADALLESYLAENPAARQEWNKTQKLKQDPRITVAGRVLRKSSMDELPQLLNVLNGTMSLVGPRPMMLCQQDTYFGQGYYRLRPGITGPWQVSDRNDCNFTDRVKYDDDYELSLSFSADSGLLLKTISTVIRGTGY